MNFRDFKIGWRLLIKEPSYSAIVIFGLSVGVAVCFLLLGLVRHQLSYDAHIAENEQIYAMTEKWHVEGFHGWNNGTSFSAKRAAVESGLPVIGTVFSPHDIDVRYGERVQSISLTLVDPDFGKIFGVKPLAGDLDAAIKRPDALALTEATAIKLFGNTDVVGKTILVKGTTYTIVALLGTPPHTTSLPYEAIGGVFNSTWSDGERKNAIENWGSTNGQIFLKTTGKVTPEEIAKVVKTKLKAAPFYDRMKPMIVKTDKSDVLIEHRLVKLRELNTDAETRQSALQNPKMLAGLSAIAILILALAATNYLNLATVRALRRQREIAMRKVLGASANRILQQFFSESILVCFIAALLGLLVAWWLLPMFSDLVSLKLEGMFSWQSIVICLALSIVLGLFSGSYPAWSALKVLPNAALSGRGNSETVGGLRLRRILTVLQFATAMGLSGVSLAVAWQTYFVSHLDAGFDPKPLLVVNAPEGVDSANGRAFRDAIARLPGVSKISVSNSLMRRLTNGDTIRREGREAINLNWLEVNPDFFNAHEIKPLTGRIFDPSRDDITNSKNIVINASAAKKLGFLSNEEAVGANLRNGNGDTQVIGVVPDVRNANSREPAQASYYFLGGGAAFASEGVAYTIRSTGDREKLQAGIEALWNTFFPNAMLRMNSMESKFAEQNAGDMHIAQLLTVASFITIVLAGFGIYVLAAYSVQRRTKEIVLRKLYGASKAVIVKLVGREFVLLIGIGAVLGLPFAYYYIQSYMADFQERAPIGVLTLVGALVVGLLVALLSTLRHTISAVRIAPVQVLRD
jgi:putative ABC transport system permease protein